LVREDSGHGMLFHTFDGELMMILHRPFENARGKPYEMQLLGYELRVLRRRTDLDGGDRRVQPRLTHVPCSAERAMASSAAALATASAAVGPYGVPSAIERRKWYASMTFRSS
jgi:hypothetical protein